MWGKSSDSKKNGRPETYEEAKRKAEARVTNEKIIQLKAKLAFVKQKMRIESRKTEKNEKKISKLKQLIFKQ